jgi:hypothetical protein
MKHEKRMKDRATNFVFNLIHISYHYDIFVAIKGQEISLKGAYR